MNCSMRRPVKGRTVGMKSRLKSVTGGFGKTLKALRILGVRPECLGDTVSLRVLPLKAVSISRRQAR
jgi:hypothetical protein